MKILITLVLLLGSLAVNALTSENALVKEPAQVKTSSKANQNSQATKKSASLALKQTQQAGQFQQQKWFQGFNQPFHSSGTFHIGTDKLVWHTQKPINNKMLINQQGVFSVDAQGSLTQQAGQTPYNQLLGQLLTGNVASLATQFHITPKALTPHLPAKANSCQQLVSKDRQLTQLIAHFVLCTDAQQQVMFIRLVEPNGSKTEIHLMYLPVKTATNNKAAAFE